MKVISDTLEPIIETWDDPGDYPSGAGGGPLPSHKYIATCDGELVLELDIDDMLYAVKQEVWDGCCIETSPCVLIKKLSGKMELIDGKIRLTVIVEECEGDVDDDGPDYEKDED